MKDRIIKTIMNNKNTARRITIINIKLYYRVIVIKNVWQCHKNKHLDQCNKTESPDMTPYSYSHVIIDNTFTAT